ncbi:MAG: DegT/DnrJ/EryC1/StrS family aminotransferase, partial [Muribaculaceae bacterium]|nr:DegT/DnrJ/EryC1/StrS family aminotransferase [Muribaculaceae bacterium]
DADNERRREIARRFQNEIRNPAVELPYPASDKAGIDNVFHLFPILLTERNRMQKDLAREGIQTIIHYPVPPHLQKCYAGKIPLRQPLPVAEYIASHELSLPISPVMTEEEVSKTIEAVNHLV